MIPRLAPNALTHPGSHLSESWQCVHRMVSVPVGSVAHMCLLALLSLWSSRKGLAIFQSVKLLSICPHVLPSPCSSPIWDTGQQYGKWQFFPANCPFPCSLLWPPLPKNTWEKKSVISPERAPSPGSILKSDQGALRVPQVKFQGTYPLMLALQSLHLPFMLCRRPSALAFSSFLPQHRPCFVVLIVFPSATVGYLPL